MNVRYYRKHITFNDTGVESVKVYAGINFNNVIDLQYIYNRYRYNHNNIRKPISCYDYRTMGLIHHSYILSQLDIDYFTISYNTLNIIKTSTCKRLVLTTNLKPNSVDTIERVTKYVPIRDVEIYGMDDTTGDTPQFPCASILHIARVSELRSIGNTNVKSLTIDSSTLNGQCVYDISNMKNLPYLDLVGYREGHVKLKEGSYNVLSVPNVRALRIYDGEFNIRNIPYDIEYLDMLPGMIRLLPYKRYRPIVMCLNYVYGIDDALEIIDHIDTSRLKVISGDSIVLILGDNIQAISEAFPGVTVTDTSAYRLYPKTNYARIK